MALSPEDRAEIAQLSSQSALQAIQSFMMLNPRFGSVAQPEFKPPDKAEQAELMDVAQRVLYPSPAYVKHRWTNSFQDLLCDKSNNGTDANKGLIVTPTNRVRTELVAFLEADVHQTAAIDRQRADVKNAARTSQQERQQTQQPQRPQA
jgi:hypothetical protein